MRYPVVLEKSDEGYTVSCPALPGCISEGDTETEALENIKVAIQEYLSVLFDEIKEADVREVEIAV
jgi:predicted RNase H-like HicB family nuclease